MNYSAEQFFALVENIEAEGGEHLDEMCVGREYDLVGPKGKEKGKRLVLPGCGNHSMFRIPYIADLPGTTNAGVVQPVDLCAVCDDIGHMPRFKLVA